MTLDPTALESMFCPNCGKANWALVDEADHPGRHFWSRLFGKRWHIRRCNLCGARWKVTATQLDAEYASMHT